MGFSSTIPPPPPLLPCRRALGGISNYLPTTRVFLLRPAPSPAKTAPLAHPSAGRDERTPRRSGSVRRGSSSVRLQQGLLPEDGGGNRSCCSESFGAGEGKPELLVFGSEEELSVSLAKYTAEPLEKYDHADSNYKLAYDGFLSKVEEKYDNRGLRHCFCLFCLSNWQVPIPPGQVYAINDSLSAEGAADDYETCLKQLFDLMLLGMGPDGHVASLFPSHPLVHENSRWNNFHIPVINSSANIALVATGSGKAGPVQRALGTGYSSSDLLPVQMVSLVDGKMTWFTDKEAASKLHGDALL
ncbi:unnamed protein product [Spirodela intermedia]|uniref:Glucosamine/galactosamine-6-phosphate isomerase domain-containing protein n=1 Tax=Spirodela intermedia TaxID=51605 RepID=A0A7I8JAZ0_SPIIN|nr:unnamed protein product [Spirodela intermedia]CAA6666895.1 unnamed protein product [Spirodela intermedia]